VSESDRGRKDDVGGGGGKRLVNKIDRLEKRKRRRKEKRGNFLH
jgi:hypothetical protein